MLNSNNEIWKEVEGFNGRYLVSSLGRVKNAAGKVLKTYTINSGYAAIKFTVNNSRTSHLVHRLVASAFCEQQDAEATDVNHIDGNKKNNKASNLEWCTRSDNLLHAFSTGLRSPETCMSTLGKKHKSSASKYHNVGYDKRRRKWTASVRHNGVNYGQKRFDAEEEAALHVNYIIDHYGIPNRPKNIIT